jgi:hypothetical protein
MYSKEKVMTRLLRWMKLSLLFGVLLLAASQVATAADPLSGKWKLNSANSMFDPGPAPKSITRTQWVNDESITVTMDIVYDNGETRKVQYTAKLDGKDYPISGALNADTITVKRIDERTLEYAHKQGGKTTRSGRTQVSDDGAELTVTSKGTDAKGDEFNDLMVFDKA